MSAQRVPHILNPQDARLRDNLQAIYNLALDLMEGQYDSVRDWAEGIKDEAESAADTLDVTLTREET